MVPASTCRLGSGDGSTKGQWRLSTLNLRDSCLINPDSEVSQFSSSLSFPDTFQADAPVLELRMGEFVSDSLCVVPLSPAMLRSPSHSAKTPIGFHSQKL